MSDKFDEFERRTAGIWLKAGNVEVGETFTVHSTYIDDETFPPKIYWICNCTADMGSEFREKGAECKARLGPDGHQDVKAVLGKNWIGNRLKVLRKKDYAGLGKRGIIWTGVQIVEQERITPPPTQLTRNNFEVSDHVKLWLSDNKSIIGQPIPFQVYNDTPKKILDELNEVGLLFMKDDYPHIHPDAAQIIQ